MIIFFPMIVNGLNTERFPFDLETRGRYVPWNLSLGQRHLDKVKRKLLIGMEKMGEENGFMFETDVKTAFTKAKAWMDEAHVDPRPQIEPERIGDRPYR